MNGLKSNYIIVHEFKNLNKQGEDKMKQTTKNQNPCNTITFPNNGRVQFIGALTIDSSENKPKNPYWPTKVIHNGKTTVVFFENGDKRVVTCSEEDEFNKEFGFLLALAHEIFGSKEKYRQMYTKKIDKKTYSKMKSNSKETKNSSEIKLPENWGKVK